MDWLNDDEMTLDELCQEYFYFVFLFDEEFCNAQRKIRVVCSDLSWSCFWFDGRCWSLMMKSVFRVVTLYSADNYSQLFTPGGGLKKQSCIGRFRSRRAATECAYQQSEDKYAFIFRRIKNGWKLVDWF